MIATRKRKALSLAIIKGCVPVDADTYRHPRHHRSGGDARQGTSSAAADNGHRQKFGNDPTKHRDFSAVTHVAKDKGIPPFLILHIAGHPDTTAQARRLANVLEAAGIQAKVVTAREATHASINDNLGAPGDPVTKELFAFVAASLAR